jgi:uncharacterized protein YecA (UPF0149 family)
MIDRIKEETLEFLFKVKALSEQEATHVFDFSRQEMRHDESTQFQYVSKEEQREEEVSPYGGQLPPPDQAPYKRETPKVGRNEPCPCGSGKKYKKCCGQ